MRFTEIAVGRRLVALPRVDGALSDELREWCADELICAPSFVVLMMNSIANNCKALAKCAKQ
jgi:hypothetical protein